MKKLINLLIIILMCFSFVNAQNILSAGIQQGDKKEIVLKVEKYIPLVLELSTKKVNLNNKADFEKLIIDVQSKFKKDEERLDFKARQEILYKIFFATSFNEAVLLAQGYFEIKSHSMINRDDAIYHYFILSY